jgi:antitoxin component of RelBE/YafQ-DinJ toxin-antitoxin module
LNYGLGTIEQNGNAAIPDPPLADAGTNSYWYNGRGPGMEYSINLVKLEREVVEGRYKANVIYTFTISNGVGRTRGDVVLTESAVDIIEQKGKDPQTAAKIALERLLKQGRNPFETQILLSVPFGHAEYFSRNGNYGTLPTLTD